MPTGFTAPIYDGEDITFEQFANSCLRNFGIYLRFEGKYPNLSRYEIPDKILYCNHYLFLNIFYSDYIFNSAAKLQKNI